MKALIVQLARLGDVYQSWPAIRALRRANPGAEIHVLARPRFSGGLRGLEAIDRVIAMPTRETLAPLLEDAPDIEASVDRMREFLDGLRAEGYSTVINLSFSPLSSFVAAAATGPGATVRGYTRHADGHLAIADDASAYLYAQIGSDRGNRIHLTDIFGLVTGVELEPRDWSGPVAKSVSNKDSKRVLIHIGASDARKTLSAAKWAGVARSLLREDLVEVAIIGGPGDREAASAIMESLGDSALTDLVGKTSDSELFSVIASARLLIGGDSGPMQIASLVGTPALCLSLPSVSFWETGPRSKDSRIFSIVSEDDVGSDAIAEEAQRMLAHALPLRACATSNGPPEALQSAAPADFAWQLLQAVYMGGNFPAAPDEVFVDACRRLHDANALAREQLAALRDRDVGSPIATTARAILDRADEIISAIGRFEPRLGALTRWLETERIRVGPTSAARVIESYDSFHAKLAQMLELYFSAPPLSAANLPSTEGGPNGSCQIET